MASTRRKVEESFTGMTLEQWQSDNDLIGWARREPVFKQICYILLNESLHVKDTVGGCSGERAFGRIEGYQQALGVLRSLAVKPVKELSIPEPDFTEAPENTLESPEVHD